MPTLMLARQPNCPAGLQLYGWATLPLPLLTAWKALPYGFLVIRFATAASFSRIASHSFS